MLRPRRPWWWLAAGWLALGGLLAGALWVERREVEARERQHLAHQAGIIHDNLAAQLQAVHAVLSRLVEEPLAAPLDRATRRRANARLSAFSEALSGVRTISLLDAAGTVAASNREALIGQNFAYRDYFRAARSAPSLDTLVVGRPFKAVLDGGWYMTLARIVPDENGGFGGLALATLDPQEFHTLLDSVRYAPDMVVGLVHGDGQRFVLLSHEPQAPGADVALPGTLFTRHRASGAPASVLRGPMQAGAAPSLLAVRDIAPPAVCGMPGLQRGGRLRDALAQRGQVVLVHAREHRRRVPAQRLGAEAVEVLDAGAGVGEVAAPVGFLLVLEERARHVLGQAVQPQLRVPLLGHVAVGADEAQRPARRVALDHAAAGVHPAPAAVPAAHAVRGVVQLRPAGQVAPQLRQHALALVRVQAALPVVPGIVDLAIVVAQQRLPGGREVRRLVRPAPVPHPQGGGLQHGAPARLDLLALQLQGLRVAQAFAPAPLHEKQRHGRRRPEQQVQRGGQPGGGAPAGEHGAPVARDAGHQGFVHVQRLLPQSGRGERWLSGQARPQRLDSGAVLWHGYIHDVTEAKQQALQLQQTERLLQHLMHEMPIGLAMVDEAGRMYFRNRRFLDYFGYTEDEVPTLAHWWQQVYPDPHYRAQVVEQWRRALGQAAQGAGDVPPQEFRTRAKDGTERTMAIGGLTFGGHFLATFVDRTEQQAQSELLHRLAYMDSLTGVANRRHFDQTLEAEWRRCRRSHRPLALVMVDIDHFKQFNDLYGHQAGDACMRAVAAALRAALARSHDLVARYGGEEFVCLLPECDLAGASAKAEALCQAVQALAIEHRGSASAGVVTVSAGVAAQVPDGGHTADALLARADANLYRAKERGRNRVDHGPDPLSQQ